MWALSPGVRSGRPSDTGSGLPARRTDDTSSGIAAPSGEAEGYVRGSHARECLIPHELLVRDDGDVANAHPDVKEPLAWTRKSARPDCSAANTAIPLESTLRLSERHARRRHA